MTKQVLVTVGNAMMGDDGAGPYLAERLLSEPIENWMLLDGGTMPEDSLYKIRQIQPDRVVVVDAADFGEKAGEIRIIGAETINDMFMVSTHALPLNFFIEELETFVPEVTFVGIQPAIVAFSFPMTEMVKKSVDEIYNRLTSWKGSTEFEHC
ncbi:hydrogenase maturation peptidase HycI [Vibrio variabilis]|uniref:hydrogenase maturation peptidase HycI n=1 Tax=Vibrio variabilis TaxID=990271 RepID=UPI000DD61003|nr:hydrogenase maturation peptidase HycI [Vibrio variabilis]